MLWLKAFHLIFVITWFSGLFYLPRLFVYHAMSDDPLSQNRFKVMERKLFWGIMTPSGLLASLLGVSLMLLEPTKYVYATWLHVKLVFVIVVWIYHGLCYRYMTLFARDRNRHSHVYYRWFNEAPAVLLIVIVCLAVVQ